MIPASGDKQQRGAVVVIEVDRRRRIGIEVGKSGLKQNVVGAGNGVTLINGLRLRLTQQIAESVMELFRRQRRRFVEVERVAERGKRDPQA